MSAWRRPARYLSPMLAPPLRVRHRTMATNRRRHPIATPSDCDAQHSGEQPRRLALRYVGEIGDKRNRIAPLVARGEVRPFAVVAVDFERSEVAIGPARVERDDFRADALSLRQDARQHGRERRKRGFVDRGEVDWAAH